MKRQHLALNRRERSWGIQTVCEHLHSCGKNCVRAEKVRVMTHVYNHFQHSTNAVKRVGKFLYDFIVCMCESLFHFLPQLVYCSMALASCIEIDCVCCLCRCYGWHKFPQFMNQNAFPKINEQWIRAQIMGNFHRHITRSKSQFTGLLWWVRIGLCNG